MPSGWTRGPTLAIEVGGNQYTTFLRRSSANFRVGAFSVFVFVECIVSLHGKVHWSKVDWVHKSQLCSNVISVRTWLSGKKQHSPGSSTRNILVSRLLYSLCQAFSLGCQEKITVSMGDAVVLWLYDDEVKRHTVEQQMLKATLKLSTNTKSVRKAAAAEVASFGVATQDWHKSKSDSNLKHFRLRHRQRHRIQCQ